MTCSLPSTLTVLSWLFLYDQDKKNFGRFGNWDTYCDTDVSIKWNGIKGTVTGKIKHHDEIHTVKAGYHFPLSMSSFYGDGVSKTIEWRANLWTKA